MKPALALSVLCMAAVAAADPDLRVTHLPPQLNMRPRIVASATPAATDEPAISAFSPLPTSERDRAERVIVRVRAGVELDGAPASGATLRGGASLPPGFADSRRWIVGDAVVGTRDLLLPSLGAYLLSSFKLEAGTALPTRSALVVPGDATGQRIAIKAGYAEWGYDDRKPSQHLWLRAGRQFRLDGGAMFAYFDGATVGYREKAWNVSGFVGQRVSLYVDTEHGVLFGATAAVDLQKLRDLPLKIALDYMGLAINSEARSMLALSGASELGKRTKLDVRVRMVSPHGGSFGLGRVGGRIRFSASDRVLVIGDLEQRFGGDLAYDLAAPSAVDIVDVARKLGVGLAAPIDALTLGARVDYRKHDRELLLFGRAEVPEGTAVTVDQQGWLEGGIALATQMLGGMWTTGQYTVRQYQLDESKNHSGTSFADTSASGLDRLHELALDSTLRSQGARRWRFGFGAFYRIYDRRTPYAIAAHEGRGGGRADLQLWLTRNVHLDVAGEVAQASPVLARELGTLSSARAALEARW